MLKLIVISKSDREAETGKPRSFFGACPTSSCFKFSFVILKFRDRACSPEHGNCGCVSEHGINPLPFWTKRYAVPRTWSKKEAA